MDNRLCVRALRVNANRNSEVFSFFVEGKEVLKFADISRIRRDDGNDILGYQRGEVQQHVSEIVSYLDSVDAPLFPNAITLAMSSEVKFKKSRGPSIGDGESEAGVLEIPIKPDNKKVAWIVDGQQRTMALMRCRHKELQIPVTAFISDDFDVHREQFLLVNKAKPLPKSLIDELLPVVNTQLPASLAKNRIPSAICSILDRDPESPFYQLVVWHTTDKKTEKNRVVKENSLMQTIKTSLNQVHGCLYQYKNVATGEVDVESVRKIMNSYWKIVKETFPDAWGKDPRESRLMGGVGLYAMGILMDKILSGLNSNDPHLETRIRDALDLIKPYCAWTNGNWKVIEVPWNQLQNTPRDKRILSALLIQVHSGVIK